MASVDRNRDAEYRGPVDSVDVVFLPLAALRLRLRASVATCCGDRLGVAGFEISDLRPQREVRALLVGVILGRSAVSFGSLTFQAGFVVSFELVHALPEFGLSLRLFVLLAGFVVQVPLAFDF